MIRLYYRLWLYFQQWRGLRPVSAAEYILSLEGYLEDMNRLT